MTIKIYHEFVILTDDVKKDRHGIVSSFSVRVFESPSGESEKEIVTAPKELTIQSRMLENRELDADLEQQVRFGEVLFNLLFPKHALGLFKRSLGKLGNDEGLRIRLRLATELVAIPWEYMYVKKIGSKFWTGGFLALDPRISIVRHEALELPAEGFGPVDKRRIVIAMATPQPYNVYRKLSDLPNEQKVIEETLNLVAGIDAVYIPRYQRSYKEDIPGARFEDLAGELSKKKTDIFHFSGHGKFIKEPGPQNTFIGKGFIVLADKNNKAKPLPAKELGELLSDRGIRLVILGACETGGRDIFNAWDSVVASLPRVGIPVVMAMQFSIYSDLACAFMEALYESLVAGLTIDEAVALGRVAIQARALGGFKDVRDWGVPVLYLRTKGGKVFDPVTDKEALKEAEKKVDALSLLRDGMLELAETAFDKALDHFLQATQTNPEFSDAFKAIAWSKQNQSIDDIKAGRFDEAIRKLEEAHEAALRTNCLDPRALKLRGATSKLMAEIAKKKNDIAGAKKHYTEAKRLFEHASRLDTADASSQDDARKAQQDLDELNESRNKPEVEKEYSKKKNGKPPAANIALVSIIIVGLLVGVALIKPEWIWPSYTLSVSVKDTRTGASLVRAELYMDGEYVGVTSGDGECIIESVSKGDHVIRAASEGYSESTISVNVVGDVGFDILLARNRATINDFSASPSRVTNFDSSTLHWSVSDASRIAIYPGIGIVESTGTVSVSPMQTTTYTLTATNEAGSVTEQAVVNVEPITVYLGYISSTAANLETATTHIQQMVEPGLNAYAAGLGYQVQFRFIIDDAQGQASVHLEKVQGFKSMDINFIVSGGWSSMASAALSYCNDNDMLLFCHTSTSPALAVAGDNLYRMCPNDSVQAPVISKMIQSMGVKYIVVIQRGDAWADGIYSSFEPHFEANGGVILRRIRYASEATEFANYLQQAEEELAPYVDQYGSDKCGIEVIAFQEAITLVAQAEDFPNVYAVKWFGSDGTSLTQQFIEDAPNQTNHLKIFGTVAAPAESQQYTTMSETYWGLVAQPYGYYTACAYDAAMIIAKAILEARSTDPEHVIPLIASVAYNHFGVSGRCRLDGAGDRVSSNYQIYGYGDIGIGVQNVIYGVYDDVTDSVTWNSDYLGYTPVPR